MSSPSSTTVLGYSPKELIEGGIEFWPERTHPEDLPRMVEVHKSIFAQTQEADFDVQRLNTQVMRYRLKNGWDEWIWLDNSSVILSFTESNEPDLTLIMLRAQEIDDPKDPSQILPEEGPEKDPLLKVPLRQDMVQDISRREQEILKLIASGNSAKEIIYASEYQLPTPLFPIVKI